MLSLPSPQMVEKFESQGMALQQCAEIILKGVAKRRSRILVTWLAYALDYLQRLAPKGYRCIAAPILANH